MICYKPDGNSNETDWKIAIPTSLIKAVIEWYRYTLGHCGINQLYENIRTHLYIPGLRKLCEAYCCDICKKNKIIGPGYGHLPPREAPLLPWAEVSVDLIGPWKITVQEEDIYFNALTCIDQVSNLVEMIQI